MRIKLFKIVCLLSFLCVPMLGCSAKENNSVKAYLNFKYNLRHAGDIKGANPTVKEILYTYDNFDSYLHLFNTKKSYINFQCKGTSYEDFYCEGSFNLVDKNDVTIVSKESFICRYTGDQHGTIIFFNDEDKEYLGTIYVYTPYWCRWQYEYKINGDDSLLITFEFWRGDFNNLPGFMEASE